MHITISVIRGTSYCYAAECNWNHEEHKYNKPSRIVGKLNREGAFVPNRYFSDLLIRSDKEAGSVNEFEQRIIETVKAEYGEDVKPETFPKGTAGEITHTVKTAQIIHYGPQLVFGDITKRYRIESMLSAAFDRNLARDILSLAWYITSEGSALSNNDSWLEYFENPRGSGFHSQEVTKLLDCIGYDGMMTFYKLWLKGFAGSDKVLYDLTSISYYGSGINAADWGYNRDHEQLAQVNYALLCMRGTAMPLFAWPLVGSISDVNTLTDTLSFLNKLGYQPNCLMLDRGFSSKSNIAHMLQHGYTFLQALKVKANWIYDIIDSSESSRNRPDAMLKTQDRTYYVSTTHLQLVRWRRRSAKNGEEEPFFRHCKGRSDKYKPKAGENIEIIGQYPCQAHVLFCQDLVGSSWDRFMGKLKIEYERLSGEQSAKVKHEYEPYFVISKPKYARRRTVDFNMEAITKHKNKYAGHLCFLTNDPSIQTAEDALREYSTRDYIEKDFDEMKNNLDMNRIRVHTDSRMRARLFIQFIAEIFLREIRCRLRESDDCKKMTRTQIFSHIKAMSKIHFQGKYKDVTPQLSKNQRCILEALDVKT
jgi:hypothetical protein